MQVLLISLSEPVSLVLTGVGFLMFGRISRRARQRRETSSQRHPWPLMLVVPASLMLLGSVL